MLGGDAQDRAQLRREQLRLLAATAGCRAGRGTGWPPARWQERQRLVGAGVERADDQRTAAAARSAISVSAATCSSSLGGVGAVVEEELRAQQPDALGALRDRQLRVVGVADVGEHLDAPAVREHDGLGRRRQRFGAGGGVGLAALLEGRRRGGVGLDRDRASPSSASVAPSATESSAGPRPTISGIPSAPATIAAWSSVPPRAVAIPHAVAGSRSATAPGVSSSATTMPGSTGGRAVRADELGEHAARDVADVDRPGTQVGVLHAVEDGGDLVGRLLERARRRLAARDGGLGGVDQRGVGEQQRLRREDLGLARGQPRRGRGELLARGVQRGGEPPRLLLGRAGGDGVEVELRRASTSAPARSPGRAPRSRRAARARAGRGRARRRGACGRRRRAGAAAAAARLRRRPPGAARRPARRRSSPPPARPAPRAAPAPAARARRPRARRRARRGASPARSRCARRRGRCRASRCAARPSRRARRRAR